MVSVLRVCRAIGIAVIVSVLASCASPMRLAEDYAAQDEWMKAVIEYRKAYASHPSDIEIKSRLKQTELKAADFYYQRGLHLIEQGNLDGALEQFRQGVAIMPDHTKLQQAIADALKHKQAVELYQEAVVFKTAGKIIDARRQLERALDVYPWYTEASDLLAQIKTEEEGKLSQGLALSSTAPVTLNFRQTDLKQAFEFLAKSFGVNVIFDEAIKSVPVTLFGKDVTFDQGLNLLLATTKMFYKRIGPNTLLIAPDTKEKRGQYEDHLVHTFQLNVIRAKDMADILKGVVNIKKISINEALNTIVIRDAEDVIKLVERIVESNDRKPAEIILDVEILEVNRNKSEKLGLDLGSYAVSLGLPPPGTLPISGSIADAFQAAATLTLPAATFRMFKQDVDAQILANPKIRVTSGKAAKIHVGDRVPLRAASIVDATGQTRTTFDYKEIGIRLSVEPTVNLDNSALVKLGLEVSSLGENLGTANEPAYRIGTRNADTIMLLRDGETAILGGLIRDEQRKTRVKVPGFGDIPVVGSLFTSYDDAKGRTDVLLTITPRVVRGWDVPPRSLREFYSGTENLYSDKPVFASLEVNGAAGPAASNSAEAQKTQAGDPATSANSAKDGKPKADEKADNANADEKPATPVFAFDKAVYDLAVGQDIEVAVMGANIPAGSSVPLDVMFNGQLLTYASGTKGDVEATAFNATADQTRGVINLSLTLPSSVGVNDPAPIARMTLRGLKAGVSYLVFRTPSMRDSNGETISAQVRASRVVVK
jgi:general secretion pathway protein D